MSTPNGGHEEYEAVELRRARFAEIVSNLQDLACSADHAVLMIEPSDGALAYVDSTDLDAEQRLTEAVDNHSGTPFAFLRFLPGEVGACSLPEFSEFEEGEQFVIGALTHSANAMKRDGWVTGPVRDAGDGWYGFTYNGSSDAARLAVLDKAASAGPDAA